MKVTIYTTPSCVQCDMTKKQFKNADLQYEEIDLSKDDAALEYVKSLGYLNAPVIVADGDSWSGFKLERIRNLIARKNH